MLKRSHDPVRWGNLRDTCRYCISPARYRLEYGQCLEGWKDCTHQDTCRWHIGAEVIYWWRTLGILPAEITGRP